MKRNVILLSIVALLGLAIGTASAQRMYKWVDSQGNVSYHDRPPPAESGFRVEEKKVRRAPEGGEESSASKAAVVLYTVSKCTSCDLARAHLQKRKVQFTEKNVEKDLKLQDELKKKTGALSVPTLMVGSKVMSGYTEGWLDSELDQAGYAKAEPEKKAEAEKEKSAEDGGFHAPVK